MTPFERLSRLLTPVQSPLYRLTHEHLEALCGQFAHRPQLLDTGGRKSHCTIGLHADVTVSDLPRESDVQKQLNLGMNEQMMAALRRRRSNIVASVFDDMTTSAFPDEQFDIVNAVEVLEHVELDELFVKNVHRILKPGGWFFMTTPNGDHRTVPSLDHKRHYRRDELEATLRTSFDDVQVVYAIRDTRFRSWGLRSWGPDKPVQTVKSMFGNAVTYRLSTRPTTPTSRAGTTNLIALCRR